MVTVTVRSEGEEEKQTKEKGPSWLGGNQAAT